MNRHGEAGKIPTRSPRLFNKDGYWYYTTREGVNIGPFDTQQDAEVGVSAFIDFVLHAEPEAVAILTKYRSAA